MDGVNTQEIIDGILEHHGVLGMKWGHRRGSSSDSSSGSSSKKSSRAERKQAKKVAKADKKFETIATKSGQARIKLAAHQAIAPQMQAHLSKMNNKPEYVKAAKEGKLNDLKNPIAKKYVKEYNQAYVNNMNAYLGGFTNASGTKVVRAHLTTESPDGFEIRIENASQIKHADDSMTMKIQYIKNQMGMITGVKVSSDSMSQSAIEDVLQNYGDVKVRR